MSTLSNEELILLAKGESDWAEIDDVAKVAKELVSLRVKTANQERVISAYNSGGFADADAMAICYLSMVDKLDAFSAKFAKLETALADIQEIADRETSNESALLEEILQLSMDTLAEPRP